MPLDSGSRRACGQEAIEIAVVVRRIVMGKKSRLARDSAAT